LMIRMDLWDIIIELKWTRRIILVYLNK